MRVRTLVREAALNIATGTTRAALFCLALLAVIVVAGGADVAAVADLDHRATTFRESGGSTLVYRLNAGINASSCDRLGAIPGVSAAGAVRQRDAGLIASSLPDQVIPAFDVSAAFGGFRALGGVSGVGGVLIADDLAQTLGVAAGDTLPLTTGSPRVGGVFRYPADGRISGYGYAVLIPADNSGPYDECWVETWPVSDALLALIPTVLVPGSASGAQPGQGPQLKQLNASLGTRFDGELAFDTRITRFAPVVVVLVGSVLGCVSVLRRRLELAAARHAGVPGPAQGLHLAVESSVWVGVAVLVSAPVLLSLAWMEQTGAPEVLVTVALWPMAAAVPAVVVGALVATVFVRERHLFVYFKSR